MSSIPCLENRNVIYSMLFRAASETLTDCARKRLGVQIGSTGILHTWGRTSWTIPPPLHRLGGGLSQGKWISSRGDSSSVKVMSRLFRGKFLCFLKRHMRRASFSLRGRVPGLPGRLYAKEWWSMPSPLQRSRNVLKYLGSIPTGSPSRTTAFSVWRTERSPFPGRTMPTATHKRS